VAHVASNAPAAAAATASAVAAEDAAADAAAAEAGAGEGAEVAGLAGAEGVAGAARSTRGRSADWIKDVAVSARVRQAVLAMEAWRGTVQRHVASLMDARGYAWLDGMEDRCREHCCKVEAFLSLRRRAPAALVHDLSALIAREQAVAVPPDEPALLAHIDHVAAAAVPASPSVSFDAFCDGRQGVPPPGGAPRPAYPAHQVRRALPPSVLPVCMCVCGSTVK